MIELFLFVFNLKANKEDGVIFWVTTAEAFKVIIIMVLGFRAGGNLIYEGKSCVWSSLCLSVHVKYKLANLCSLM